MKFFKLFTIVILVFAQAGCVSNPDITSKASVVSWSNIGEAAYQSVKSKNTWVPLIGAVIIPLAEWDRDIVDWASEKTPIFGSNEEAGDISDRLNDLGKLNLIASSLMTPDKKGSVIHNNATRLGFSAFALSVTSSMTNTIKSNVGWLRPDKSDRRTFPSGHSSRASTQAALSNSNIQRMSQLTSQQRRYWQMSTSTVAVLTAWARVEGDKHFFSDVLAGYALGNFIGNFVSKAFIEPLLDQDTLVNITSQHDKSLTIQMGFKF